MTKVVGHTLKLNANTYSTSINDCTWLWSLKLFGIRPTSCELFTTMKTSVFSLLVGDYFYVLD